MNITVKDVPPELHQRLRERAEESGRSLNKQILFTLEQSIRPKRVDLATLLTRIRRRRSEMTVWLEDESLQTAIEEGRR